MVARAVVVAREGEDVADTERVGTEDVPLDREPVPVPAGDLKDGLEPLLGEEGADAHRAYPHDRTLVIGDVDRNDPVPYIGDLLLPAVVEIHALRGTHFTGYGKLTLGQTFLQLAHFFSSFASALGFRAS